MKTFAYATALSPDSARQLAADHGAYLAGGNDLLGLLKDYLVPGPNVLVNIKSLPGLDKIERGEKPWTIGALVTVAELEADAEIAKVFPGLHEAAAEIASPQIRNVATVGGNLAQHSRCWYYRQRAAASGYSADSWQATAFSKVLDDDEAVEFLPAIVAERFAVVSRKQFGPCRTVFD